MLEMKLIWENIVTLEYVWLYAYKEMMLTIAIQATEWSMVTKLANQ